MDYVYKISVTIGGAASSYLFGGWGQAMAILLFFVVMDYITGLIAAWFGTGLDSKKGLKGIARKFLIFSVVALAHQIDLFVGNEVNMLMNAAIAFYAANELLSITENIGRAGLPLPDALLNAIAVLKGRSGADEHK